MNEMIAQIELDYSEEKLHEPVGLSTEDLRLIAGGECVVNSY